MRRRKRRARKSVKRRKRRRTYRVLRKSRSTFLFRRYFYDGSSVVTDDSMERKGKYGLYN